MRSLEGLTIVMVGASGGIGCATALQIAKPGVNIAMCASRKERLEKAAELVKAKFMKLNSSHIEFVMDCMRENTTKIRNIKQYLRAVLFNAPSTIDNYYTALVAHDMASGKI